MMCVGAACHSWQPENDSPVMQQLFVFNVLCCFRNFLLLPHTCEHKTTHSTVLMKHQCAVHARTAHTGLLCQYWCYTVFGNTAIALLAYHRHHLGVLSIFSWKMDARVDPTPNPSSEQQLHLLGLSSFACLYTCSVHGALRKMMHSIS